MKKHNPILAAAGRLLVALVTVGTLFPACAELETPTPDPNPKNLVIKEFRYDGIPAEGGSVKPVISYSYEVLEEGRYVKKTDGAVLTFDVSEPLILDDDGTVTAPSNPSGKTITHQVKLTVRVNSLKTEKTVGISQYSLEGVKSVEYTLLPIELGPHEVAPTPPFVYEEEDRYKEIKFISNSKDGCYTETISRPCPDGNGIEYLVSEGQRETVSCAGTQIPFTGGDLLTTITYYDGKVETEVEKAVFSVESSYPDATDTLRYAYVYLIETIPATLPAESIVGTTVADGVWTINKIDSPFTGRGIHKLIATTSRGSQSITLNQNANKLLPQNKNEVYYEFYDEIDKDCEPFCSRIYWPDFENYPPGSDPKWVRGQSGWWWNPWDTRSLHPDTNRYIVVSIDDIRTKKWVISTLMSGDEFWWVHLTKCAINYTKEGVVMTAEADIPTAEGIKHKELRYEYYNELEYGPECGGLTAFRIFVPDYPEAIDTFEWTVTFKHPGPEYNVCGLLRDGRPASNWKEVAHLYKDAVFTFKNCKDLAQDWIDSCAPWGFYDSNISPEAGLKPYIVLEDGVEIAWEKLIEGYFYSKPRFSRDPNEIPREE